MSRSTREAELRALHGEKWGANLITELGGPKRDRKKALGEMLANHQKGSLPLSSWIEKALTAPDVGAVRQPLSGLYQKALESSGGSPSELSGHLRVARGEVEGDPGTSVPEFLSQQQPGELARLQRVAELEDLGQKSPWQLPGRAAADALWELSKLTGTFDVAGKALRGLGVAGGDLVQTTERSSAPSYENLLATLEGARRGTRAAFQSQR